MGNFLLTIVSFCTFISYFPQALKLLKTKKSSDISISSWILWVTSSLTYTIYAFIESNDFMLKFETSLELFFCILILVLTLKYRDK